jgi:hypothetical protein
MKMMMMLTWMKVLQILQRTLVLIEHTVIIIRNNCLYFL